MSDPEDPGDDWGFPEVDPASPALPPEPEPVYDTGSDAWWRQQAEAQRRAAAADPVVPPAAPPPAEPEAPPELVEPSVLNAPEPADLTPLDAQWVPPELPELRAPDDEPADEPVGEEPYEEPVAAAEPEDAPEPEPEPRAASDWHRTLAEAAPTVAAPMPAQVPPAVEEEQSPRPPHEGERVGPARALAGAALALAGVVLGIGAIFVLNDKGEPTGGPVVAVPTLTGTQPASPTATSSPTPSQAPTAAATTPPAVVVPTRPPTTAPVVPVRVLNNSRISGLADRAAARFRAGGWPVPQTGNYRGLISSTTIYYAAGEQDSAVRFAQQFGIARVLPRSALPGIPVPGTTVILTRDYRA